MDDGTWLARLVQRGIALAHSTEFPGDAATARTVASGVRHTGRGLQHSADLRAAARRRRLAGAGPEAAGLPSRRNPPHPRTCTTCSCNYLPGR
ncbi:hypothetical protein ACFQV4_25855 [Streptomyces thermocarboxydus]